MPAMLSLTSQRLGDVSDNIAGIWLPRPGRVDAGDVVADVAESLRHLAHVGGVALAQPERVVNHHHRARLDDPLPVTAGLRDHRGDTGGDAVWHSGDRARVTADGVADSDAVEHVTAAAVDVHLEGALHPGQLRRERLSGEPVREPAALADVVVHVDAGHRRLGPDPAFQGVHVHLATSRAFHAAMRRNAAAASPPARGSLPAFWPAGGAAGLVSGTASGVIVSIGGSPTTVRMSSGSQTPALARFIAAVAFAASSALSCSRFSGIGNE